MRIASRCGFRFIACDAATLAGVGLLRVRDLLTTHALEISSISEHCGYTRSVCGALEDAIACSIEALRFAAELGVPYVNLSTGSIGNHIRKHARRLVKSALEEILARETGLDVAIALSIPQSDVNRLDIFESRRELLDFIDEIDETKLGITHEVDRYVVSDETPDVDRRLSRKTFLVREKLHEEMNEPLAEISDVAAIQRAFPHELDATASPRNPCFSTGFNGYLEVECPFNQADSLETQKNLLDERSRFLRLWTDVG